MYRLLDLITELGSSGLGNRLFLGYSLLFPHRIYS